MRRCIDLALKGDGSTAPNPMVGAVIVYKDKIIGEGYHQKYGESHAEVNAIKNVQDKTLLSKSTIYVSLEPCGHFGKTPPCADLIIENKIPHIVIGSKDPFSMVNGKGIDRLNANGLKVEFGILEQECRELNKRFFTFHEKKRPYVVLKWAQTKSGFFDRTRKENETGVNWISAAETKSLVHLWRSKEMGILIGRKTAEIDNPKLDVRAISGKNPIRIILDSDLKLKSEKITQSKTILLNTKKTEKLGEIDYLKLSDLNIETILDELWRQEIQSILVEGGADTIQRFIDSEIWDEVRIIEGETDFSDGLKAPKFCKKASTIKHFGTDTIYYTKQ